MIRVENPPKQMLLTQYKSVDIIDNIIKNKLRAKVSKNVFMILR